MITEAQLAQIYTTCPKARREFYLPHLTAAMTEYDISTGCLRAAAFLAQVGHETGELRWMSELASGDAYEGRKDLGNTHAGDGRRYKGRGAFQLTGRANYATYGEALGLDLIDHPEQAAEPEVAFRIAGLYWTKRGLNALADVGNFTAITRAVNGGLNGQADRVKLYVRARQALGC